MGRDYNIHITWRGQGSKQAFGGSNLATSKRGTSRNTEGLSTKNLQGFVGIGMVFKTGQMSNEIVGAYTENRLGQRKFSVGMTMAKYVTAGVVLNPVLGGIYAVTDLSYRIAMYQIDVQKKSREADYYKRLSGNNSASGSRYRGSYS